MKFFEEIGINYTNKKKFYEYVHKYKWEERLEAKQVYDWQQHLLLTQKLKEQYITRQTVINTAAMKDIGIQQKELDEWYENNSQIGYTLELGTEYLERFKKIHETNSLVAKTTLDVIKSPVTLDKIEAEVEKLNLEISMGNEEVGFVSPVENLLKGSFDEFEKLEIENENETENEEG